MHPIDIKIDNLIKSNLFPEIIEIKSTIPIGNSLKIIGVGKDTRRYYEHIFNTKELDNIEIISSVLHQPLGNSRKFRLGIEALRLGLAYEYDPYFSLSIARVDPLPHQLEAVYEYFLKLPRVRFLLADDPGAGKTIMAGLLIKELKIRGLINRVLILTPANLTFQWQRELKEKFRESFKVMNGAALRSNYGSNPWIEDNQLITSVSWVSVIEDAQNSLLRSHWDLIIVDEAHKMSARDEQHQTLTYQLGKKLSELTDHFLLMTATPHKGDPKQFRLFLELLDKDVYGDISSLQDAIANQVAPFYLRRVKEALVTFPDPDTGKSHSLFTRRNVKTVEFQIGEEELDFYDQLTRYVEDQSIKAAGQNTISARAVGFTMAMLQRRFSSSVRAVRKTLERMKDKRQRILDDPEGYRKRQIDDKIPEEFDDLTDDEQQDIIDKLEGQVISVDPISLKEEISQLTLLIDRAIKLEEQENESKLVELKKLLTEQGIFRDPKMKLLIFTEHKDTLDFIVEKLDQWGLKSTQIHGGMKVGDRNTPGSRIFAETEFRDACQILVATEAAGEGINLQFCWLLINYDIPWNPIRLEQRMGRIHRYGQEKDCLIFNFVSTNTREGRVLAKLFERIRKIEEDLDPNKTGKVFNVLGDVFPSNQLERMIRDMYAKNETLDSITSRIVEEVDTEKIQRITNSTLEGLAKKELNLKAIIGKSEEAKERRLIPEVIEDFFIQSSEYVEIKPKTDRNIPHVYHLGKIPRILWGTGEKLESKFGKLGHEYNRVVFDKEYLKKDQLLEWLTPGHPLFETVRQEIIRLFQHDLNQGAVFYDIDRNDPVKLDVFTASIKDGRGNVLHKKLLVTETTTQGDVSVRQPTLFLDLAVAPEGTIVPSFNGLSRNDLESALYKQSLVPLLDEIKVERDKEIETIRHHINMSLDAIIDREQYIYSEIFTSIQSESAETGLEGRLKQSENRLSELLERKDRRLKELDQESQCSIADIDYLGFAWVLPHPERHNPSIAPMVRDEQIEKIAVQTAIAYEESNGWKVESVESENRGFDLISRKPHPQDPQTSIEVKFIEVKGRAFDGEIALSSNEYKTAQRLGKDFWLYTVLNCAENPTLYRTQDPARLSWNAIVSVEHYAINSNKLKS